MVIVYLCSVRTLAEAAAKEAGHAACVQREGKSDQTSHLKRAACKRGGTDCNSMMIIIVISRNLDSDG